jgi:hypothetical protein
MITFLASTSVWLNGTGYIKYNLARDNKDKSPLRNYVGFRFRTPPLSDGVILHTRVERHFLVIELLKGNIVLKLDLGKGTIHYICSSSSEKYLTLLVKEMHHLAK